MQFIEQDVATNAVRASLLFFQKQRGEMSDTSKKFAKNMEIVFLLKWFKFGRMALVQKLLEDNNRLLKFTSATMTDSSTSKLKTGKNKSTKYGVYKDELNKVLTRRQK